MATDSAWDRRTARRWTLARTKRSASRFQRTTPNFEKSAGIIYYRELKPEDRAYVKEREELFRDAAKRSAQGIVKIGLWLTGAKDRLEHGQWLPCLKKSFGWSRVRAGRFMQVHEPVKCNTVEHLEIDVSTLYLIAAPRDTRACRQRDRKTRQGRRADDQGEGEEGAVSLQEAGQASAAYSGAADCYLHRQSHGFQRWHLRAAHVRQG
jgi:hypothetical protein